MADPAWRAQNPYLMRVVTNPNARPSHAIMDGYLMSSDFALANPQLMAPLDYGCDCVDIPISSADAISNGITGSSPSGTPWSWAESRGASVGYNGPTIAGEPLHIGSAPGFQPPMQGAEAQSQLSALKAKAAAIRAEDPRAFGELLAWLIAFFGWDILSSPSEATPQKMTQ